MNGRAPQSSGVAPDPQEAPVAESDTAIGEPFVTGWYQIPEGDTESGEVYLLLPQLPEAQFSDPSLMPHPAAGTSVAMPLYDVAEWWRAAARQLAPFSPGALSWFANWPRFNIVLDAGVPYAAAERAGTAEVGRDRSQEELERHVTGILEAARDEHFEDGMESSVSSALLPLVERYHTRMAEFLFYWVTREKADPEVTAEVLHWLGGMDHPASHHWRRRLLERCLEAPSVTVRDAAGIGLAAMDDPQAAPSVRGAIARERCEELRRCLQQVLAQLEGRPGWRCF